MRRGWRPWRAAERQQRTSRSTNYVAVVEPGTTILRLLVVETAGGQATVWGWAERPMPATGDVDVLWLVDACSEALAEAEEMARGLRDYWFLPDQMAVGLPATLLRGGAWPIVQRRSRPHRPVEERELGALLERALRLTVNHLAEPEEAGWAVVDAAPAALTVDGRGVTDPVGFRGQEIGAMAFAALAAWHTVDVWETVARSLEFSTLMLTASPLALAASLTGSQGILLDVGGAATDLIWWQSKRPVAIASLPWGGEALTQALMREWRLSPQRAERLKHAYAAGTLAEEDRERVLEILAPELRAWLDATEEALARLNEDEPLPQRLSLMGGGSLVPEIADATRALAWSEHLQFARYPQVDRMRPTDVPGVVNRTELGRQAGDVTALALAAWGAQQSLPPDRPRRLLTELWCE